MDWGKYEEEVFGACKLSFPNAQVVKDVKIRGRHSKRSRQIDIMITETVGGKEIKIAVDCKYYNKKADIKKVESFIGMLDDIGADKGLMISEKGYTESALQRAYNNPQHLELDIYSLEDFKDRFHGELAIPMAGENGAIIVAPFGWIVDARRTPGAICYLYQRGLTFDEAGEARELAYINFWDKKSGSDTLDNLLKLQEDGIRDGRKVNYINYQDSIQRNDAKTVIRIANVENYPAIEVAAFIDFKNFIFFCVWFSKEVNIKRNIRKLENMMKSVIPLTVRIEDSKTAVIAKDIFKD
ncbi:restriction endonuclease [Mucilaginibacter sp. OK283]|uniref:restriction endonuclease n=1 Tax=Mucilaginibacter sp. OK283 TaxID=1881049 RepID=UPI0008C0A676|nr:restriction endonuclease [Mucilaginibacter sp. OK283]SEP06022.1 Restriction endonuclease [Mucilaginibacter sp. OK283]